MQGDEFTIGAVVSFSCDEGYQLGGAKTLTCKDGDKWDGEFPFCDKVSCGLPKPLNNAVMYGESYEFEDVIEYRCNRGYDLAGESTVTCRSDGTWTTLKAKCIRVSCGQPPTVEHSAVVQGETFNFEDVVVYKCDAGYEVTGHNLLECGPDGKWSGPTPSCEMVTCGKPPVISNATTIVSKTTYGSKARYVCNKGYILKGSKYVKCVENKTWLYDQKPRCDPINCGRPPTLQFGGVKVPDFTFGNTARYYCLAGYILQGHETLQCQADGLWNGHAPQCIPVRCPAPLPPKNGDVNSQGDETFTFSKEIKFSCKRGFNLVGPAISRCQDDGSWSGSRPRCDRKF